MIVYLCNTCQRRRHEIDDGWQNLIKATPKGMRALLVCPECVEKARVETWNNFWRKLRADMGLERKEKP